MKKVFKNVTVTVDEFSNEDGDYKDLDVDTLYNILSTVNYKTVSAVFRKLLEDNPHRMIQIDKNIRNRIYEVIEE